jgi:hypothetical protein
MFGNNPWISQRAAIFIKANDTVIPGVLGSQCNRVNRCGMKASICSGI